MTSLTTEYTEHELLESHPIVEPLVAGGVRCHGGFDDNGTYVSPRTKNRWPAIEAWQRQREEQFGTPILDIPLETWPEHYPNVAQAKYLVTNGVPDPVIAILTRIGTVEGFGSMIRYSVIPELQKAFDEDVSGTAMDHLGRGLYEAHARDEAGFEDEGGHKQMWFAARDVAFENPVTEDQTATMLARMGIPTPGAGGGSVDMAKIREQMMATRVLPDDISYDLESLIERMTRLLLIEISAYHAFAWAEDVLSDHDLVAGDGEAARLVSYIRTDEAPHVAYLKTTLSEMRDRTFVGTSGKKHKGSDMIGRVWDRAVSESLGERREQQLAVTVREIEHALEGKANKDDLLEEFHSLGSIRPEGSEPVKFGIFYEHQLPRPWVETSEQQLIQDALDQVELADRLGFHTVWEVEHHFLEEYSHSSAPEVFLAACSQRTKNIRLGHGIVQTPPAFNHPARVAERIGMLDLVSNGRVEFGTGESSSEAELGGFKIDPFLKREMWQEGLEVAVRCMTEAPFTGVDGKYVQMPPRNVIPKPVQKPHPPIWVACSRRDTIHLAAQKGIGALTFAFIDPEEAKSWLSDYHTTLENEGLPIGKSVNANVACVTTFMCAPTEDEAIAKGLEGANFFGYSLGHYYVFGDHQPGITDVWQQYQERRDEVGFSPEVAAAVEAERLGAKVAQDGVSGLRGAVGSPDQIRDYLRRYEDAGVDQIIFVSQAGKNRHEDIMESLELFGKEVLPEFLERDERDAPKKAKAMEPLIEKAMARKVDDGPPLPSPDYSFPAIPKQMAKASGNEQLQEFLDKFERDRAAGIRDPEAGIAG